MPILTVTPHITAAGEAKCSDEFKTSAGKSLDPKDIIETDRAFLDAWECHGVRTAYLIVPHVDVARTVGCYEMPNTAVAADLCRHAKRSVLTVCTLSVSIPQPTAQHNTTQHNTHHVRGTDWLTATCTKKENAKYEASISPWWEKHELMPHPSIR